jgi:PAS domain S-box-containing protein
MDGVSGPAPGNPPESGDWFRQIVELAPNALVLVDAAGHIALVNAETERLFGYAREDLVGQSVERLVPDHARAQHAGERAAFLAAPRARQMGAGRDLRARRSDGTEFPVEIGLRPLQTGRGAMVLASIFDVTERRRHEERFRRVAESAPSAMVMVDPAGHITLVNAQAERMFGHARDALLGQSVELLVPDRFRDHHPRERDGFLAEPRARAMGAGRDLFAKRADGSEFPVEIGLNPLDTDEGPMVLAAIVDITERKQAEELIRASLHEKEVLLQEVYHRVKNNLQVLVSLISLQERALSDPAARDALRQSANRVKAMSLVHEMLYRSERLSNLDLGRYLAALVEHLMDTYDARGSGIVVDTQIEAIEVRLEVAIPLGLVINELVTNCLKHAFKERAEGRVSLRARRDATDRIEVVLRDDGSGIAAHVDTAATGTLGLQVVRALTAQLGGEVSFNSGAHGTEVVLLV